jgi:exodeoxyribonuclease VII large subunit
MDALLKIRVWRLKLQYQQSTIELFALDRRLIFMQRRDAITRMQTAMRERIQVLLNQYALRQKSLAGQLQQLNPTSILERGFAIVFTSSGNILCDPHDAKTGDSLTLRLAKGTLPATVGDQPQPPRKKAKTRS